MVSNPSSLPLPPPQVEGSDVQQDAAAVDDYISEWSMGIQAKLVEAVEQLAAAKVSSSPWLMLCHGHLQSTCLS